MRQVYSQPNPLNSLRECEVAMFCNTQVTFDTDPAHARSESVVAANPRNPANMVGSSKRFTNPALYEFSLGVYATFDAGETWSEAPSLSLLPGWAGVSDPAVAWDARGNVYLIGLPFAPGLDGSTLGIAVYRSTDGGRSWSGPNVLHTSTGDDKQWAAGDTTPSSTHYGNVYSAWDDGSTLRFARTTDNGASWKGLGTQPPGSSLAADSFAPSIAVAHDGTIYIVWVNGEEFGRTVKFVKSTDGGNTFTSPAVVADGITPLQSPPLGGTQFPEFPGATFRVLTLPTVTCGSGGHVVAAWADYREGMSRIYHRHSGNAGTGWDGDLSGSPMLTGWRASGPDQHDFHPQLASLPFGEVGCAFYSFGPKSAGPALIDVAIATSDDGGGFFNFRDRVTNRAWNPAIDAPLSHGRADTTFIGEYFGLGASAYGFFPFWTDTRTGVQEIFVGRVMRVGPWTGQQFTGTVAAGAAHRWFTWGWPACWHVVWTVRPTSPRPGGPQLSWNVQVERASGGMCTYWISVTNLTSAAIDVEAHYAVLAAD